MEAGGTSCHGRKAEGRESLVQLVSGEGIEPSTT
jgi:hypothetical protein